MSDNQIFICGRCLGASLSIYLSSHRKPKALFLISAFKSIINISNKFLRFFIENIFKSIDYIGNVKCPILFIHGKADDVISHKHSEDLFQKTEKNNINNGIKLIEGKGHNNLNLKEDIIGNIIQFCFLKKLLENKSNEILLNSINMIKDEDLYIIPLVIRKF